MTSIRMFMVVALLSTIVLVNFLAALHGYQSSLREAEKLFDQKLSDTANLISVLPANAYGAKIAPDTGETAFQIFNANEDLQWRSGSAPATPFASLKPGFSEHNFSGHRWRTLVQHTDDGHWILVGERLDQRYRLADSIILESVIPIVLSIPLVGFLVWLIIGFGLKSLQLLARELADKRADDLSQLSLNEPPRELLPVLRSTNSLLARLEASFERERRFSSDAAHELRTPLSALQLHVYNLKQELPEQGEKLAQLERDVARMAHLVEQILALYRTTPEHYPANFESLDLYELARECLSDSYAEFEVRAQQISLEGERTPLRGDRFALQLLIQNLLNNANKYTPEGGRVSLDVSTRDGRPTLTVNDSGPGIAAAQRERVLERFYRVGGDRHASGVSGCGLGLSIVQHIAQLHHAVIRFGEPDSGTGLSVQVQFPKNRIRGNDQR